MQRQDIKKPCRKQSDRHKCVRYHLVLRTQLGCNGAAACSWSWIDSEKDSRVTRLVRFSSSHHPLLLWEDSRA